MKKSIIRKGLVIGIIILFVGASVIPSMGGAVVEKHVSIDNETSYRPINNRGDTLYVGGSGPNNYSKIQDAINDASNGDTVFVYDDSSPYYESVIVDKSINLIGEDKNTTIIDGNNYSDGVFIVEVGSVTISGFTIQNHVQCGIEIYGLPDNFSNNNTISNNNIYSNNWPGIWVVQSSNNTIFDNNICCNNKTGVSIEFSNNNTIFDNNICSNNGDGIHLYDSSSNAFSGNTISSNNETGVHLHGDSDNSIIKDNNISLNSLGIYLGIMSNGNIIYNNYINNTNNAYSERKNIWNTSKTPGNNIIGGQYLGGNYWSDYPGRDLDGDGIGDTKLPWNCFGDINVEGDWLPLYKETGITYPPVTYVDDDYDNSTPGWGVDHFDNIQDGIDSVAINGTVYVYNGTYYENVVVDIPVDLIGEDRNTTTIVGDGNGDEATVEIIADWVNISGFTSQHSVMGIRIFSHNIIITGNTVTNNAYGIHLDESCSDVIVEGNAIVNNNYLLSGGAGICVYGSDISIRGNLIGGHAPPGMLITLGNGATSRNR